LKVRNFFQKEVSLSSVGWADEDGMHEALGLSIAAGTGGGFLLVEPGVVGG